MLLFIVIPVKQLIKKNNAVDSHQLPIENHPEEPMRTFTLEGALG